MDSSLLYVDLMFKEVMNFFQSLLSRNLLYLQLLNVKAGYPHIFLESFPV